MQRDGTGTDISVQIISIALAFICHIGLLDSISVNVLHIRIHQLILTLSSRHCCRTRSLQFSLIKSRRSVRISVGYKTHKMLRQVVECRSIIAYIYERSDVSVCVSLDAICQSVAKYVQFG